MALTKVRAAGAEGLTLSSTDLKIDSGDLIFGTSAKGVVLGATSNTDANTLEDTSLTGQYTKIGRTVYLQARTVGNAGLNISSFAVLQGMPFAPTDDSDVGVYVIGTISSRAHGWTTIVSGNAWYFSTASSPSNATNIDASIVYRTTA
jgi:hypothetical protein